MGRKRKDAEKATHGKVIEKITGDYEKTFARYDATSTVRAGRLHRQLKRTIMKTHRRLHENGAKLNQHIDRIAATWRADGKRLATAEAAKAHKMVNKRGIKAHAGLDSVISLSHKPLHDTAKRRTETCEIALQHLLETSLTEWMDG